MKPPMIAPRAIPISSMSRTTIQGLMPSRSMAAVATVVRAMTPLTDRSIPPDRITRVMPTALISR